MKDAPELWAAPRARIRTYQTLEVGKIVHKSFAEDILQDAIYENVIAIKEGEYLQYLVESSSNDQGPYIERNNHPDGTWADTTCMVQ